MVDGNGVRLFRRRRSLLRFPSHATSISSSISSIGMASSSKLILKLLIDSTTNRVLFGEASKEFVDFLFSILACPIGHLIDLFDGEQVLGGSIGSLYKSLKCLPPDCMQPNTDKNIYLKPKMPIPFTLGDKPLRVKFYTCYHDPSGRVPGANYYYYYYYTDVKGTPCPLCNKNMQRELQFCKVPVGVRGSRGSGGFYVCSVDVGAVKLHYTEVKGTACPHCERKMETDAVFCKVPPKREGCVKGVLKYRVTDNLEVEPIMSTISTIALLNKYQIKNAGALVEKVVEVGLDEALALLKASFESKTVPTHVFGGIPGSSKRKRKRYAW